MLKFFIFTFFALMIAVLPLNAKPFKLAFIDRSENENGKNLSANLQKELKIFEKLRLTDRDLNETAAKALEIENFLNLSREDARNFGAAVGADFILIAKSDVLQRSALRREKYFEAFICYFLFETRGGNVLSFNLEKSEKDSAKDATENLQAQTAQFAEKIFQRIENQEPLQIIAQRERRERFTEIDDRSEGVRIPLPFRRARPVYTTSAALYGVETTVDALVLIDEKGIVQSVEIERSGGFGLDESVTETVKKMIFRPALRDGKPFPARFVLRYNFKRLEAENSAETNLSANIESD